MTHTLSVGKILEYFRKSATVDCQGGCRTARSRRGGQLDRIFSSKFETMGLEQEVVATGRKRIKEFPYSKEPDHSWKPLTVAQARSTKWPTLVVERGWTESLNRLHLDAE